ncbi:MAG TPA: DUF1801 domain-containing protein [Candidatus Deferrimicrobium sp.]|nr:DUF1801 domain-containing protein [Candidatus Deferrimicrobium sp.]
MTADERVAAYLADLAPEARTALDSVRATVRDLVPDAEETISYGIPTFTLAGRAFVHVAAWKRHVSIYPVPRVDAGMEAELAAYRNGPGTLRFPLGHPLPLELIGRVVVLLMAQRAGPPDPAPPQGRVA